MVQSPPDSLVSNTVRPFENKVRPECSLHQRVKTSVLPDHQDALLPGRIRSSTARDAR